MKRICLVVPFLLLAGCAGSPPDQTLEAPAKAETAAKPELKSQPLKHLAGRNLKPMPDRELNVRTRCRFKDVNGGHGSLDLQVVKADVKRFSAEVNIPKQGVCRFDMNDFEQTARMPNVVLAEKGSACTVRMWEQELGGKKGVTVSFNSCQTQCTGDAFSYLWPILVDARNGRCS
ncbi:hypothetical protein [Propionivibrio limicola]|uniref:hypothetical protein n=1 Tax=Propionivibrio limicola TaxID=167645 RepID=UPI001290B0D6|nr:hypothetical protein [Propionivibrio limicola]